MHEPSVRRRLIAWPMPPLLGHWPIGALLAYFFVLEFANRIHDRWLLDSAVSLAQQIHVEEGKVSGDLSAAVRRSGPYLLSHCRWGRQRRGRTGRIPDPPSLGSSLVFYDGQTVRDPGSNYRTARRGGGWKCVSAGRGNTGQTTYLGGRNPRRDGAAAAPANRQGRRAHLVRSRARAGTARATAHRHPAPLASRSFAARSIVRAGGSGAARQCLERFIRSARSRGREPEPLYRQCSASASHAVGRTQNAGRIGHARG